MEKFKAVLDVVSIVADLGVLWVILTLIKDVAELKKKSSQ